MAQLQGQINKIIELSARISSTMMRGIFGRGASVMIINASDNFNKASNNTIKSSNG